MERLRIYVDTSVFGGCFDEEFKNQSRGFFQTVFDGKAKCLVSDTLIRELEEAPQNVKELLKQTLQIDYEQLSVTPEVVALHNAYLSAGVVTGKYVDDALHVAHATVARADVIVSWNFKHLVNPVKIRAFNGVNTTQGYGQLVIMTPSDLAKILEQSHEEEKDF